MKLTFLFLLVIFSYSCSTGESNLYEFDPRNLTGNKVTLSEIADDITYIPFDDSIPVGDIYEYKVINSFIYLSVKDIGILVYNNDGKLIRKIGSSGRGPGEYQYFMNFDIDPNSKSVYVLDHDLIKVYTGSGQFQRSISLIEYDWRFDNISFFDEKLLISENIYMGEAKYSWLFLDTTGILLKKKYNPVPPFKSNLPSGGGCYIFDNKIFYWELYNDTVFSILPDLIYKASFLFSPGEHRWPKSMIQISPTESFKSFLLNHLSINLIIETKRYLIMRYTYKKTVIALIDKMSQKTFLNFMESEEGSGNLIGGILNNLDGGTMFQPQGYFVKNGREYLTGLLFPYQLKAHITNSEFINTVSNYPEKKKELENLANSLKETDNPVLMMVRLKK